MTEKALKIPGYHIEDLLGKGGMASVFQARQKSFNREVALKVYSPSDKEDEDGFGERFLQESRIVAKLHHSHIVQVYDVGQFENQYYISMEYLHGGNLAKRLATGLRLKDAVTIIKQAASALDFAHRKRIIHRDIKPENMMFREDGAMVLTDFGIAKELESQSNLTQTGLVIGTPRYMSPEQIRGDDVDHRTDIYALGIVFFRCLTNYLPFDGKDIIVTSFLQHNEPIPKLPKEVACFQPIINKMLEKFPDERYQRGKEVVDALEALDRNAYSANLTNLDVAAASKLSPPTVTRSTSGSFATKASQQHSTTKSISHAKALVDGVSPSVSNGKDDDETLALTHARPIAALDPLTLDEMEDDVRPIRKQSSGFGWVMTLAVICGAGFTGYHYFGESIETKLTALFEPVMEREVNEIAIGASSSVTSPGTAETTTKDVGLEALSAADGQSLSDESRLNANRSGERLAEEGYVGERGLDEHLSDKSLLVENRFDRSQVQQVGEDPVSADQSLSTVNELTVQPESDDPLEESDTIEQVTEELLADVDSESSQGLSVVEVPNGNSLDGDSRDKESFDKASSNTEASDKEIKLATLHAIDETSESDRVDDTQVRIEEILTSAEEDLAKWRLTKPASSNAYTKFQEVLELDPENQQAQEGIQKVGKAYLMLAESALNQQQFDNAQRYLDDARLVAPDHELYERVAGKLGLALEVFEEQQALEKAESQAELIQVLLTEAAVDEQEGRVRSPKGNNALEKYQRILSLDPENTVAIEKLVEFGR